MLTLETLAVIQGDWRLTADLALAAGLAAALAMGDLGVTVRFAPPDFATLPLPMPRLMATYRTEAATGVALVLAAPPLFLVFDRGGRLDADA